MRKPDFGDAMLAVSHVLLAAQDWKRAYESETAPKRHAEDRLREALDDLSKIDEARGTITLASPTSASVELGVNPDSRKTNPVPTLRTPSTNSQRRWRATKRSDATPTACSDRLVWRTSRPLRGTTGGAT